MGNELLEMRITALEKRVSNLEKRTLEDDNAIEYQIMKEIISSVCSYFAEVLGLPKEETIHGAERLFEQTGFVSLDTNNNSRVFIYALNPSKFIGDNQLWNWVQKNVADHNGGCSLCIGQFDMNDLYGIQISTVFNKMFSNFKEGYLWTIK